jgi:hypothetical protein
MRLGVIYDSQVASRREGGISARTLSPPVQSYWSPGSQISPLAAGDTQNDTINR